MVADLVLGIDTATRAGSVALARGDRLCGVAIGDANGTQSTQLLSQIQELLDAERARLDQVGRIAVAIGPGSFTGLRIGLATVKGLAATLGCVVDAVPTLSAVAVSAHTVGPVVAMLPAGRGEVFAQHLMVAEGGVVAEVGPPAHLPLPELLQSMDAIQPLNWVGVAGMDHLQMVADHAAKGLDWRAARSVEVLAASVIRVARVNQSESSAGDLTARYVRLSDAELKLRCQP